DPATTGVQHVYSSAGAKTATLTVSDGHGGSDVETAQVTVSAGGPFSLTLQDADDDALLVVSEIDELTIARAAPGADITLKAKFIPTNPAPIGNQARNNDAFMLEWV